MDFKCFIPLFIICIIIGLIFILLLLEKNQKKKSSNPNHNHNDITEMNTIITVNECECGDCICPICQESIEYHVARRVFCCNGMFHLKCLPEWMNVKKSCPLCGNKFSSKIYKNEL